MHRLWCSKFVCKGYKVVSGGTDNHLMLIDLRTRFPEVNGRVAETELVKADITVNKNMVPFDSRSAFRLQVSESVLLPLHPEVS